MTIEYESTNQSVNWTITKKSNGSIFYRGLNLDIPVPEFDQILIGQAAYPPDHARGGTAIIRIDNISITGFGWDPDILIEPVDLEYDFGFVELLESRTTTVTITNDGGSDLAVSDIKLVEYVDGDPYTNSYVEFGLVEPVPTVPVIIPQGGTQEVLVEYIPKYIYNWASLFHVAEAELVITSDDPDELEVRVAFSGKGAQDVDIDQSALDFVEDAGKLYNANMITLSDDGKSGGNKFNALLDTVLTAGSHIAEGNLTEACDSLWGAYKHIDGQDKPKDHIYGEGTSILANSIAEMMAEQACPQTP